MVNWKSQMYSIFDSMITGLTDCQWLQLLDFVALSFWEEILYMYLWIMQLLRISTHLNNLRNNKVIMPRGVHTSVVYCTIFLYSPTCRWQRKWGVAHKCCQMQSLSRLSLQNPEAMPNLRGTLWTKGLYVTHRFCFCCVNGWRTTWVSLLTWPLVLTSFHHTGHTIVFTDQSGMNASGHVMLGTMDVHHQWTMVKCVFVSVPSPLIVQKSSSGSGVSLCAYILWYFMCAALWEDA